MKLLTYCSSFFFLISTFASGNTSALAFDRLAAYSLLNQRTTVNLNDFFVYRNADSGFNHGFASGFFPSNTAHKIHLDIACLDDNTSLNGCSSDPNRLDQIRGTVMRISFDPLSPGEFVGLNIEEPENSGAGIGYNLQGATQVTFKARSPDGLSASFGVGGGSTAFMSIPNVWTSYSFPLNSLAGVDLSDVHLLFTVVTDYFNSPNGGTVLLDDIRFDPAPTEHIAVSSFPLSTETFGVQNLLSKNSGRVPIPSDQVLRNLTTTYESAIVTLALLNRGSSEDLINASIILDAFHYALKNPNQGNLLPVASDGSNGLHNAYSSGDLALRNSQASGSAQAGEIRFSGFSSGEITCGATKFCLNLDGATGGNIAFAILAFLEGYEQFNDLKYLNAARELSRWIEAKLADNTGTGYGGYFIGYPDEGKPKVLLSGKSVENIADIYAAFQKLSAIEKKLGNAADATLWENRAFKAGDFVMQMFDSVSGCFFAGTVPLGQAADVGIDPTGTQLGNEVINRFLFIDANTFITLTLANSARYRNQIDWRRPVNCVLNKFTRSISVQSVNYLGFSIDQNTSAGPDGIAWEFTGQAVVLMKWIDRLYNENNYQNEINLYLNQLAQAQANAPFADNKGLVASTVLDGDLLIPLEQCLSTPFQCIPQRVGLAASVWAIYADNGLNILNTLFQGSNTDSDQDGLPDAWELQFGLNPLDSSDSQIDTDNDNINNLSEFTAGSNPLINIPAVAIQPVINLLNSRQNNKSTLLNDILPVITIPKP